LLTADQRSELDRILKAREEKCADVKSLRCRFTRWEYDSVFNTTKIDSGHWKLLASGEGSFEVEGPQPEKWVWTKDSICEFNYAKRQLIKHHLPLALQRRLVWFFTFHDELLLESDSAALEKAYFLRVVTPPEAKGQIWLEFLPRFTDDAACFSRAVLILDKNDLLPFALQVSAPHGKSRTVYRLEDVVVNDPALAAASAFDPIAPDGWETIEVPSPKSTLAP
jgi:hypothetical protein